MSNSSIVLCGFLLLLSCSDSDSCRFCGKWKMEDGRVITVKDDHMFFNENDNDLLSYRLDGDIISFTSDIGETWRGTILEFTGDSIVYYDSLFKDTFRLGLIVEEPDK